jgi:hypothetical protein
MRGLPNPPAECDSMSEYTRGEVEEHFAELVAGVEDHAIFLLDRPGASRAGMRAHDG